MGTASVIIPTRNRAEILPETLRALSRQSFPPEQLEVVVLDDGSTDETEARLRATRYPFRLVSERLEPREDFCPARPRNAGLRLATGDVAIFLDADLLAGPDLVAGHVAAHASEQGPAAVIGYTYGYPRDPGERTPEVMQAPPADRMLDSLPRLLERDGARWRDGREPDYAATRDLADHTAPWQAFWTSNASVERRLALEIGGFDEEFVGWGGEDTEFAYRLHQSGVRFALARSAWGVHYPHPLPDTDARRAEAQRNRRRLIAKHPTPELEMQLWSPRLHAQLWRELDGLLRQPPVIGVRSGAAEIIAGLQTAAVGQRTAVHLECGGLPPLSSRELAPVAGAPILRTQERRVGDGGTPPAGKRWQATALQIGVPWMRRHDQTAGKPVRPPLLCGPAPPGLAARLQPAAWCQPFECGMRNAECGIPHDPSPFPIPHSASRIRSLPLLGVFTPWEDNTFGGALVTDAWRCLPPIVALGLVAECVRVAGGVELMCRDAAAAEGNRARPRTLEECGALLEMLRPEYSLDAVRGAGVTAFLVSRRSHQGEQRQYP